MRLLLFSNSTNYGESFLEYASPHIESFLGKRNYKILFIPFAIVSLSYDLYFKKAKEKFNSLGYEMESIHLANDQENALQNCDCIVVGGGNTFQLLSQLQISSLMNVISRRVKQGIPYIGWSAGINLVCPTISTTNDMPIIETENLNGLNLIPFQINPHYTELKLEMHSGESRDARIDEYLCINHNRYVMGLREGSALKIESKRINLIGNHPAKIFRYGRKPVEALPSSDLNYILE